MNSLFRTHDKLSFSFFSLSNVSRLAWVWLRTLRYGVWKLQQEKSRTYPKLVLLLAAIKIQLLRFKIIGS